MVVAGRLQSVLSFLLIWFLLTGTDWSSWLIGVPAVLAAVLINSRMPYSFSYSLCLSGCCRFLPFFLRESFYSALDVMRRTVAPKMLLRPGLIPYESSLPLGAPLTLFVNTISLLPGTLSADLKGREVLVHCIDTQMPVRATLQVLESRVAACFREKARVV